MTVYAVHCAEWQEGTVEVSCHPKILILTKHRWNLCMVSKAVVTIQYSVILSGIQFTLAV
jgi:hypothetical protein